MLWKTVDVFCTGKGNVDGHSLGSYFGGRTKSASISSTA